MTPSDAELIAALAPSLPAAAITARRPHPYASSHPLEEVRVRDGGGERSLILKRLAPRPQGKPEFLYDPQRELLALREILTPAAIGPELLAAGDSWLLLERVPGVELWQVGDVAVWEAVARWLAGFHAEFTEQTGVVRAAAPQLLTHDDEWYATWCQRALVRLRASDDARAPELVNALTYYDRSVLIDLPQTLIHGELYPSNVLVDLPRVSPVDWEMAAVGPGVTDLAALVGGWDEESRARVVAAYGVVDATELTAARLQLALQWIGWSERWEPPPEHDHDWVGEALTMVRELGL